MNPHDATAVLGADAPQPVRGERQDVVGTRPERREGDGGHEEPVVEIPAEGAVGHHGLEVPIGGGDDLRVHADLSRAPDPQEGLVVEEAEQLGLAGQRHVADLVEEERAAVRDLRRARAASRRRR